MRKIELEVILKTTQDEVESLKSENKTLREKIAALEYKEPNNPKGTLAYLLTGREYR